MQYLLLRTDILQKTVCLWVPLSQYGVRPFKCYFFRGTFRTFELFSALKEKKVWISFVQFDDREIPPRLLGLSGFSDE